VRIEGLLNFYLVSANHDLVHPCVETAFRVSKICQEDIMFGSTNENAKRKEEKMSYGYQRTQTQTIYSIEARRNKA